MQQAPRAFDLDDKDDLNVCQNQLQSDETSSFAVSFNAERAHCSLDLEQGDLTSILEARDAATNQTECLWLNLWGWQPKHHGLIQQIADRYNVPQRIIHILCPKTNGSSIHIPLVKDHEGVKFSRHEDLELASHEKTDSESPTLGDTNRRQLTSIADIANDLWHFFTVDFGSRYICIAWNALFFTTESATVVPRDGKPNALRIWSALLLCDDGTIVSVFESPPHLSNRLKQRIRSNQLNVFRHLSRIYLAQATQNALMQVTIRNDSAASVEPAHDMASLVFYYLSDNWLDNYAQVTGGEHSYRHRLEQLRESMIDSAQVELVRTLHQVGKQLTALKLVYKSYPAIVERLIDRHRSLLAHDRLLARRGSSRMFRAFSNDSSNDPFPCSSNDPLDTQLRLTTTSLARFERLLDRIEICAITEVDECLKEKEALVLMNFNLVSLKESQAVEKLTRITILLAKATLLFLPISLVTSYFSMQFPVIEQSYSLKTFWLTFLVVAVLTLALLLVFGITSERYSGKVVFRSLTRSVLDRRKRKDVVR